MRAVFALLYPGRMAFGLALLTALPLAAQNEMAEAWRLVGGHLYTEAGLKLKAADAPRERELAQAVILAAQQPVTDEKLVAVERRLLVLAEGQDEVAAAALYFVGRLRQVHFAQPDYAKAAEFYRMLAERQPASAWAQLGLVKLALLTLYQLPEPTTTEARLAAAAALLPHVTIPRLRRDLLIVLGRTRLFYDQPLAAVLADLLAADAIGGLTGVAEGGFLLQIGELSFRSKKWAQAQDYFTRYLQGNGADPRSFAVRKKLAVIEARLAGAAAQEDAP